MKEYLTPVESIRTKCLDCCGCCKEVRLCPSKNCPLHILRMGKNPNYIHGNEKQHPTSLKAIRAKCSDCSGGCHKEVRNCQFADCALYPYRMGTPPIAQFL